MKSVVFDYVKTTDISAMPLLPIRLESPTKHFETFALVDSGAGVNVLPYAVGLYLGLRWDDYKRGPNLTGNADNEETRVIVLECFIPKFGKLELGFAWTNGKQQRVLLGQQNFFKIFDVCFIQRQGKFTLMYPEMEQA